MKRPSEVALSCLISNVCLASTPSGQSTHHQVLKQKVTRKASAWVSPPRTVGSQYMSTLEFKKKTVPILPRHSWSILKCKCQQKVSPFRATSERLRALNAMAFLVICCSLWSLLGTVQATGRMVLLKAVSFFRSVHCVQCCYAYHVYLHCIAIV